MKTFAALPLCFCLAAHAQGNLKVRQSPVTPGLPPAAAAGVRMCDSTDLSLATDDENGSFNGMNHSGTLLVLRNLSPTPCRIQAIPEITFAGKSGPLKATAQITGYTHPGLGHGPVVLPIIIPADAEVTSKLRWVSGEVYSKSVCISPTRLSVTVGEKQQSTPIAAHLCGDATAGGVTYERSRFATDPVYTPDRAVHAPQLPQPE